MHNIDSTNTASLENGKSIVPFAEIPISNSILSSSTLQSSKTRKRKQLTKKGYLADSDVSSVESRTSDASKSALRKRKSLKENEDHLFKPLPDSFKRSGKFAFRIGSCFEQLFSPNVQKVSNESKVTFVFDEFLVSSNEDGVIPKISLNNLPQIESKNDEKKTVTEDLLPQLARLNISRITSPITIIDDLSTTFSSINIQDASNQSHIPDQNKKNPGSLVSESEQNRHVKKGDMWKHWLTVKNSLKPKN